LFRRGRLAMRAVSAAWLRGGTSKGLFLRADDVPPPGPVLDRFVLAALGSPDPSGLQLNGVGGGISSTSKVAILSSSQRPGCEVDYLFGQVDIKERNVNWQGSCGNLAAGVGLFALAEGLVEPRFGSEGVSSQSIRVWQVNQGYGISLHVPPNVAAPLPKGAPSPQGREERLCTLAGVPGQEPLVYVELDQPHGDSPLLPTGREVDKLHLLDGRPVKATLVTAGNPTVFVDATSAGLQGTELPEQMNYTEVLPLVEHLRSQAMPLFGMQESSDQPRVAFVSHPQSYCSTFGKEVHSDDAHLLSRISTPGRIHHAHTGTGSIALACAAQVVGSIPWGCIPEAFRPARAEALRIGHPGGVMEVRANVQWGAERGWHALGAGFERTARYVMRGEIFVPTEERAP